MVSKFLGPPETNECSRHLGMSLECSHNSTLPLSASAVILYTTDLHGGPPLRVVRNVFELMSTLDHACGPGIVAPMSIAIL